MKRLAVLGRPVGHSRSPQMHNAALRELGLDDEWEYGAIEVAPEDLASTLAALPEQGYVGVNITIPHKEAALALADSASEAARAIGAANTLTFGKHGIHAENTDAPGLLAALGVDPAGERALVLGAGGAGRAAAWALKAAGAEVTIWNRTAARGAGLAAELGVSALPEGVAADPGECEILVNTTAIGLHAGGNPSANPPSAFKEFGFSADKLDDRLVVADLVYGEAETELVAVARQNGATTIDGLEVLVRQGAASLGIWTGLEAPLATMRRAARTAAP